MILYSKKILQFVGEIRETAKKILSIEIGLTVTGNRFYDRKRLASYPLCIVIYNNKPMLGYFDPNFYELGFHESLMHAKRETLHDVIRHELAHYITFIEHGEVKPHGVEFKAFCCEMPWKEEVSHATVAVDVLRKVEKLMALAGSANEHEAELALMKSQELLLKHNLEYFKGEEDETFILKRTLKRKREDAKMRAIAKILENFFVSTIFHKANGCTYLEILGTPTNVEIADYIAAFLDGELEWLWKGTNLKGQLAKNSFFLGLAKGYCNKLFSLKKSYDEKALVVLENQLIDAKGMAYPHLSKSRSRARRCLESTRLGEAMGQKLHIRSGIPSKKENPVLALSYR